MNALRWLWAAYSYHFGGWDYRRHQCPTLANGRACRRYRHHPGAHRFVDK